MQNFNTELSALAVKTANSSFSAIGELSRLVSIYGDKKEVKLCWVKACEDNGLVKATSTDYWSLATFQKIFLQVIRMQKTLGLNQFWRV